MRPSSSIRRVDGSSAWAHPIGVSIHPLPSMAVYTTAMPTPAAGLPTLVLA